MVEAVRRVSLERLSRPHRVPATLPARREEEERILQAAVASKVVQSSPRLSWKSGNKSIDWLAETG